MEQFHILLINIGPQRTGTITIAGKTFTVTQVKAVSMFLNQLVEFPSAQAVGLRVFNSILHRVAPGQRPQLDPLDND